MSGFFHNMEGTEKAVVAIFAMAVIGGTVAAVADLLAPKDAEVARMEACHSMCFASGTPSYVDGDCTCGGGK